MSRTERVETEVSVRIGFSSGSGDTIPHIQVVDERSSITIVDIELTAAEFSNLLGASSVEKRVTVTTDGDKIGKFVNAHSRRFESSYKVNAQAEAEAYQAELAEQGIQATLRKNNFGNTVIYWTYHDEPQNDWQRDRVERHS